MEFVLGIQGQFIIQKSNNVIHHLNRIKEKPHMITSTDVEKNINNFQHPFMIKTLSNLRIVKNFLNLIKGI